MFWIFAILLIILALAMILPPLLKKTQLETNARRDQNIQIAKEQLAELETAFANNEMQHDDYLARRDELEQALYSDTSSHEITTAEYAKPSIISTIFIALMIPAIAFGMYAKYGNPKLLDPEVAKTARNIPKKANGEPDIDAMVTGLRKKLEANPDNAEGWYMLGRSYMALNRFKDATYSYEQLYKLAPNDAKIMLFLADASAMANNGNVTGKPAELIEKSLKLIPNSVTGLWLGGMASSQQGNHAKAIERWTALIPLLSKQPEQANEIRGLIADAKKKLSPEAIANLPTASTKTKQKVAPEVTTKTPQATHDKSIVVTVTLSEHLKNQANANDSVFIYAKAMSGPPMPLAAKRFQVKDLPITITLDDSTAMMPAMKLSGFPKVIIGARISKSGNAIGASGDLYSEKKDIALGTKQDLMIDSVLQK
ncbi:MAG TPA: c-type cytochrome biogenesis protein CcmI [Leucothrix mucor]|uniref:C-type cytochrome biogenesis protein CcmI n=1 Tax=Leucothrix mucor TaxID=45248 RepID=A0A7V2T1I2_LEUMU|nr:c-type cytochrome biogenesis protein CcmI [Leucothrix mucor]